jgi:Rieske Fe-S protein
MGTIDTDPAETAQPSTGQSSTGQPGAGGSRMGHPTRRTVLLGVGVIGAGAAVATIAACGPGATATSAPKANPTASKDLGKTSAIPVNGGVIFPDQNVVVTQPAAGTFKAFSATCTHAGCQVGTVSGGLIMCPCHGSEYSITDGSVTRGPAPTSLAPATITVANGEITLA